MLDQILALLGPVISGLSGQFGWLASALMWMATLRLFFKPLMTFAESVTAATETKSDNEFLTKVKSSTVYKAFAFLLDYTASIKLPKATAPAAIEQK